MFRPAFRAATTTARAIPKAQTGRRFASTSASKSGSWKGAALRWTAAGAIVYYYNTSSVFAEEPQYAVHAPLETPHESETYSTVDSIAERRRARARATLQQPQEQVTVQEVQPLDGEQVAAGGAGALEEEAEQQGAFNEETGEINWDCPCLGGMAYGPCGEQFRAAFSCFVYSKEDPKGVDCIEHFKTMQNCFREHPEIYGSEMDEEEVDAQIEAEKQPESQPAPVGTTQTSEESAQPENRQRAKAATEQAKSNNARPDETDEMVPKAWHDTPDSNMAK